jgi:hypothetical protein
LNRHALYANRVGGNGSAASASSAGASAGTWRRARLFARRRGHCSGDDDDYDSHRHYLRFLYVTHVPAAGMVRSDGLCAAAFFDVL